MAIERENLAPAAAEVERQKVETTLEALRRRDTELRATLESSLPDDERFQALLGETQQYLAKVGDVNREGIERARALAAVSRTLEELARTERGRLNREFADVDRRREEAQAQVEEFRRMAK